MTRRPEGSHWRQEQWPAWIAWTQLVSVERTPRDLARGQERTRRATPGPHSARSKQAKKGGVLPSSGSAGERIDAENGRTGCRAEALWIWRYRTGSTLLRANAARRWPDPTRENSHDVKGRDEDMRHQPPEEPSTLYHTALRCYHAGINVLPIRADGSKRPALQGWRIYQQRRTTPGEIHQWFHQAAYGLAVMTGDISGGLEALDIDSRETYQVWLDRLRDDPALRPLYERIVSGYLEATPDGGRHLLYRCQDVGRNQALARRARTESSGYQPLIETRGNGGLLIIAPSGGSVHPSGRPYTLLSGGVTQIATITPPERSMLLCLARSFDETPIKLSDERTSYLVASHGSPAGAESGTRPGDLFNQSAHWEDILCPHGWRLVHKVNEVGQWRRPGKRGPGISATTNYAGNNRLYVFSTATIFEPERSYTKFSAYTVLEHAGDFSAAARALVEAGYVQ